MKMPMELRNIQLGGRTFYHGKGITGLWVPTLGEKLALHYDASEGVTQQTVFASFFILFLRCL